MIRHILFSEYEAFKLKEFMLRAEKHLPVKYHVLIPVRDALDCVPYNRAANLFDPDNRCVKEFISEGCLSDRVLSLLEKHEPEDLVCLLTTDEMLVSDVDEGAIEEEFKDPMMFSFSLRLGKNIVRNSMVGMNNKVVPLSENEHTMKWDWDKHYVDFSGPLSVHGHYFRVKDMYRMIKKLGQIHSYDELEEGLQVYMNFPKKLMSSFVESRAVSIDPLLIPNERAAVMQRAHDALMSDNPLPIVLDGPQPELHFYPFKDMITEINQWKKQRILFKYPARGREEKFLSTLKKYHENLINKDDFQFLISIDEDDDILNTDAIKAAVDAFPNTKLVAGTSQGKIHAVNRDMDQADPWDIVVLVSDDMIPKMKGFDMLIRKDMKNHFPDLDGVLWYNDGHKGAELNTLCILGKTYYDRFGHIYWPGYKSLYCLAPETMVYMADHTMKPISDIEVGDIVVGSEKRPSAKGKSTCRLEYLTPTKVTAVHKREAPILRIEMESGAIVRCTPDHVWAHYNADKKYRYDNRSSNHRKSTYEYGPVTNGLSLVRAVKFPKENEFENFHKEVGWLAGIFDGEGSFPRISQSLTHNPAICAEIERVLKLLGFNFKMRDEAHSNGRIMRQFYLCGGRDEYFKFLCLIRPIRNGTKQVQKRMFCARFGQSDKIVSINEDGFGVVHCITTETGNFVANGYLSHNCDNDFMEVSKRLGKVHYNSLCIIEHQHWAWGYGEMDDLYTKNETYIKDDHDLFQKRLAENFGLAKELQLS